MQDMIDQTPSEEDERIYALWQSGKTLRVCAREMGVSPLEAEYAIDRCLPPFSSASQFRAYKRDLQRLDDVSAYYYAKAMAGDLDSAHIFARVNERRCAMSGWSSMTIKMDPIAAQTAEQPTRFDKIHAAIMRVARGEQANGGALAPPISPATDENPDDRENP